jgi:LPXTG-motif cell wall-anchored protein
MASFPYATYTPVPYDAKYDGYGGYGAWYKPWTWGETTPTPPVLPVATAQQPTAPPSDTAWVGDMSQAVGNVLGMFLASKADAKKTEAILESNERVAIANAEANAQAMSAQLESDRINAAAGISGTTIAMVVGGIALLGGAAYYVYRKKK